MLSPDRSEPRAGGMRHARRRAKGRVLGMSTGAPDSAFWEPAQSFDPSEPWDARSAEALTRLYESEEGSLSRPAPREPARPEHAQTQATAAETERAQEPVDRTWLEAHLSRLARRLQSSLTQSDPKQSLSALNERLDAFEQRFSAALGRVAHRSDLDGLKSIEASVMELAAQLNQARDRLELIGDVDEEVRGLARKLDEGGERRAGALEKLMRDCMAEWRESERRTASALQSLEDAVSRLGDTVDAMEASRPAPELTVPPLAPELERPATATDSLSRLHTVYGGPHNTHFYHSMLDAADYAPGPAEPRSSAAAGLGAYPSGSSLPAAAVEWAGPSAEADLGRSDTSPSTAAGWHVMAMREKLRRAPVAYESTGPGLSVLEPEVRAPDTFKRTRLNILLMAGAAILAGTTYFLSRTVAASLSSARPDMNEAGPQPADGSELADPADNRMRGEGAS
jgi:hypothetical protein